jgi:cell wall-associated NlpC family hydrolase
VLHGVVAAVVGLGAASAIALPARPPQVSPTTALATTDPLSPPLLALDIPASTPTSEPLAEADVLTPTPATDSEQEKPPPPPKPTIHTVEDGETVRMLAAKFGISPETLLAANNLRNPDMLKVGQDLVILPTDGVLYALRPGETLRRVAERFSVELGDIIKANDLGDPDLVQPGTLLMVPGATPASPARSTVVVQRNDDDGEQHIAAVGPGVGLPIDVANQAVPSTRTYEVQAGDTLAGIAEVFGVDVDTILSSNGIADPDTIKPGSDLRILPVKGLEYAIQPSETLADIAWKYQVDLGLLLDYNDLDDPDMIRVGAKLVVPGGKLRPEAIAAPAPAAAEAPRTASAGTGNVQVQVQVPAPAPKPAAAAPKPAAPAPKPQVQAPTLEVGGGGGTIVSNAMKYLGYRYVFGGTSPAGFDCSGFVYYIHNRSGAPVGRGMWQQYNGGGHIPMSALQPGDTVFFANTYMPGLSHDGIYIGGGQFIHASDERTGVTISSLYTGYWQSHYVGATRLWD